jgi:Nucleotidyltransferase domain
VTVQLGQAKHRGEPSDHAGLRAIVNGLLPADPIALALYGSQARGTAGPFSDIDLLAVVEHGAGSYSNGRTNVTAYLPATLERMAEHGSLFVLHLKTDAKILADDFGVLRDILRRYRQPASYDRLFAELRAAGSALVIAVDDKDDKLAHRLRSLAVYLIRSGVYAQAATAQCPIFDMRAAADFLGLPEIAQILSRHVGDGADKADLQRLAYALSLVIGPVEKTRHQSVESLAVDLSDTRPYAAALLAQVLVGTAPGVDYTALTPPPL